MAVNTHPPAATRSSYFLVDPSSRYSWSHSWDEFLGEGESISTRLWSISPLHKDDPTTPTLANATDDVVFVSGMRAGNIYYLKETITTNASVIAEQTITLRCDNT